MAEEMKFHSHELTTVNSISALQANNKRLDFTHSRQFILLSPLLKDERES
jgi:hypothetical protein